MNELDISKQKNPVAPRLAYDASSDVLTIMVKPPVKDRIISDTDKFWADAQRKSSTPLNKQSGVYALDHEESQRIMAQEFQGTTEELENLTALNDEIGAADMFSQMNNSYSQSLSNPHSSAITQIKFNTSDHVLLSSDKLTEIKTLGKPSFDPQSGTILFENSSFSVNLVSETPDRNYDTANVKNPDVKAYVENLQAASMLRRTMADFNGSTELLTKDQIETKRATNIIINSLEKEAQSIAEKNSGFKYENNDDYLAALNALTASDGSGLGFEDRCRQRTQTAMAYDLMSSEQRGQAISGIDNIETKRRLLLTIGEDSNAMDYMLSNIMSNPAFSKVNKEAVSKLNAEDQIAFLEAAAYNGVQQPDKATVDEKTKAAVNYTLAEPKTDLSQIRYSGSLQRNLYDITGVGKSIVEDQTAMDKQHDAKLKEDQKQAEEAKSKNQPQFFDIKSKFSKFSQMFKSAPVKTANKNAEHDGLG